MPRIVRGALLQATWTGDKESMIQKHEGYAHEAAKQGAQVMLLPGAVLRARTSARCRTKQYYSYTEPIPDGPTTKRMQDLAKQTGHGPRASRCTRRTPAPGIYYNTAAVIDADGTYLGKYRKTHIPHVKGFWEKFYFRPGNLGYPVFETAVGKVGVYICYDRHFPEGARALGLNGAEIVFNPSATQPRPVRVPVALEQPATRRRERLLRRHHQPGRHRGRSATTTSTARATSSTRAASSSARSASPHDEELIVRDLDLDLIERGPPDLAVLPRPAPRPVRRPRQALGLSAGPNGTVGNPAASAMIPRGSAAKEEGSRAA